MLDLRDLERFLAIVRYRNFGRAAVALGMSQPPLSRQIANLEKALGVTLFSRERRQIELTPAGEVFAREARALLAQARASELITRDAARGAGGRLRLGCPSSDRYRLIPRAIRAFLRLHPEAAVTLDEPSPSQQLDALQAGTLDVVLVRGPHRVDGLQAYYLRGDPLVAVLPEGHELAGKARVRVEDFEGLPTVEIGRRAGGGYNELVRGLYARAGLVPRVVHEVDTLETLLSCVAAGIGAGIVHDASRDLQIEGAVYRPLSPDGPQVTLAAVRRFAESSPLVPVFLECLRGAAAG